MSSSSSSQPNPNNGDVEQGVQSGGTYGSKRLQMAQAQVNEVIDVMKNNVTKVMERETQLNSLDHRAEVLQNGASQFQQSSRTLRQKYWWQNMRLMIIIGAIVFLFLLVIIIWISS